MNLSPVLKQRFFDANGAPLSGGLLYTYLAGTSTPQATYSNSTGTANANPVVLDSSGYADVWLDTSISYKFVLEDVNSNALWTVDAVTATSQGLSKWNANTVYSAGDIVEDNSGFGLLYVSLTNSNQNNALTSVSNWRVFAGNVRNVSSSQTSPALLVTDDLIRSNSTSGNLTHTLPAVASCPVGKRISIKDIGSGGNTTSVKGSGSETIDGSNTYAPALTQYAHMTVENNGTSWDVVNLTGVLADGSVTTAKIAALAVTTAKIANNAVGQAQRAALGQQVSGSSGGYSTSSGTLANVTNLSATIVSTGRPVAIRFQPDGTQGVNTSFQANTAPGIFQVKRDSTVIMAWLMATGSQAQPGAFNFIDTGATAASHTYTMQASSQSGGGTTQVSNLVMMVYEL